MFISETFTSLQGEGSLAGVVSFFIRTSGCNLRCRWCDTPYTSWVPEGTRRSVEELVAEAEASGARHVVVTGGEPLLQREIAGLTRRLKEAGLHITVETAGTGEVPRAELGLKDRGAEYVMMGLRLAEGIDLSRLEQIDAGALNMNEVKGLTEMGLVETVAGRLRATQTGRPVLNAVLRAVLA